MSADWIKMRTDLLTSPKVVRMSSALREDRHRIAGGLLSVWSLFDAHSEDGKLTGYSIEMLDELAAWEGFSSAMVSVGWLSEEAGSLVIPRFDAHNGASAKRRAQDSDRKREARKMSAFEADKNRTREEKRREEYIKENKEKKPAGKPLVSFSSWMEKLISISEKPIPEGDTIFQYADDSKIPHDWLRLVWVEFKEEFSSKDKRQRDWRAHFRNFVRKNYYQLWWVDPDSRDYKLTSRGQQAMIAMTNKQKREES